MIGRLEYGRLRALCAFVGAEHFALSYPTTARGFQCDGISNVAVPSATQAGEYRIRKQYFESIVSLLSVGDKKCASG